MSAVINYNAMRVAGLKMRVAGLCLTESLYPVTGKLHRVVLRLPRIYWPRRLLRFLFSSSVRRDE